MYIYNILHHMLNALKSYLHLYITSVILSLLYYQNALSFLKFGMQFISIAAFY